MLSFSSLSELPLASAVTTLNANAFLGGVSATLSAGALDYEAKAETTMPSATGTTAAGTLDYDAKANKIISSVIASVVNTFGGIANTTTLSGVSSTVAVNVFSSVEGKATVTPSAATVTSTAGTLDYDADANTTLPSVSMGISYGDFVDEDAQASITLSGVSASGTADWNTATGIYAINVVYSNTDFERSRTVNVVPYGNYTVYVTR